jgi:ABC-type antimicrobial peptide transport system permease subunit
MQAVMGGIAFGSSTFTTNVVALRVGPGELMRALILSFLIGAAGGLPPAWHAARLRPIEALRKA